MSQEQIKNEYGLTRIISIIYLLLGFGFVIAVLNKAEIQSIVLYWKNDIWIPLLFILTSIGTIRLTRWGRWFSYVLSVFCLLGVPIGTLLGAVMIWHLTKYRTAFNRWY